MGRNQEKLRTAPGRTAQEEAKNECRRQSRYRRRRQETLGSGQGGEESGVTSRGEESWPHSSASMPKTVRGRSGRQGFAGRQPERRLPGPFSRLRSVDGYFLSPRVGIPTEIPEPPTSAVWTWLSARRTRPFIYLWLRPNSATHS